VPPLVVVRKGLVVHLSSIHFTDWGGCSCRPASISSPQGCTLLDCICWARKFLAGGDHRAPCPRTRR